jgi:hypothetical protein
MPPQFKRGSNTKRKKETSKADVLRPVTKKKATTTRPVSTADVLRPIKKATPRHMYDLGGDENKFPKMYKTTDDEMRPSELRDMLPPLPPKPPLSIQPEVGPVGTLRSRAVRTHNISPEGYRDLRKVSTHLDPPADQPHGGLYYPEENRIEIVADARAVDKGEGLPGIYAHEGAHANWFNQGYKDPDVQNSFRTDFNRWRDEAGPGSVPDRSYGVIEDHPELYSYTPNTELHAYSVGLNPGQREPIPDYMQGWYNGYLNDMQPRRPNQVNRMDSELYPGEIPYYLRQPDENGNMGSAPLSRWR